MKHIFTIFCCVILLGCVKDGSSRYELQIGDCLPDFEAFMNDGTFISTESLKGSVSVVVFFHSSCHDCQQTLPVIQEVYDKYLSQKVNFILISRSQSVDEVSAYFTDNCLTMPYSAQNDRTIYEKFAKSGIPRIYVNDKYCIIRHTYSDESIPTFEQLCTAIDSTILLR